MRLPQQVTPVERTVSTAAFSNSTVVSQSSTVDTIACLLCNLLGGGAQKTCKSLFNCAS